MAALRRGIAHYQGGEDNVPEPAVPTSSWQARREAANAARQNPPVPVPAPAPAPAPESAPAGRSPFGSIGDMYAGQYQKVLENPNASAFSQYLAGVNQAARNQQRAQILATGPSLTEKLFHGIFGNQADWEVLKNRDATAKVLSDPLAQQHLINNPDHLAVAEKDPHGYVQSPVFKDVMQKAQDAHAELQTRPGIPREDHPEIVNTKLKVPDATVDQIHAGMKPENYTKEEFRRAMLGAPLQVVQALFGAELSHYVTPQETLTKKYFDKLHNNYNTAAANVARMEAENQKAIDEKRNPPHQSSWFGKSLLDQEKEKMQFWEKKIMDDAAAAAGITTKPFAIPSSVDIR
jgi:hypothetical protein